MKYILLVILFAVIQSCGTKDTKYIQYHLGTPSHVYRMAEELQEISGISLINENEVACIQDETGEIFIYNMKEEKITNTIEFSGQGDFEDIVTVGKSMYILRSDGKIFLINDYTQPKDTVLQFDTPLNKENDAEGICFDEATSSLFISCKGKSEEVAKDSRGIYGFNIKTNSFNEQPVLAITLDKLKEFVESKPAAILSKNISRIVNEKNIKSVFVPSALSIHPITKDIYILSSVNNLLVIVSREGVIKEIAPLQQKYFMQPEGIAFNKKGDMFISNEGKNKQANILMFNYAK